MKTLIYLFAIAMLLFAGCAKDEMFDDNINTPELKKAKVPIPTRSELCGVADPTSEPILKPKPGLDPNDPKNYIPSVMIISGKCTQMGKIDSEQSYYKIEVFKLINEGGVTLIFQSGHGFLAGANGDGYYYTWWVKTSMTTFEYVGGSELQGGTGRFEGVTGESEMSGKVDQVNNTNCWTAEGWMIYE